MSPKITGVWMQGITGSVRRSVANMLRGGANLVDLPTEAPPVADAESLGKESLKYLSEIANDSFKRQLELDESVWRSLPFFAASFAFIATVAGKAATDIPPFSLQPVNFVSHVFLYLAFFSLAWALRWFVPILRERVYEYPSSDEEVKKYAFDMNEYYSAINLEGEDLDRRVHEELRLFMIDQHGSAAKNNFGLNGIRMKARSRALLFMLAGFVLAFFAEASIFLRKDVYHAIEVQNGSRQQQVERQGREDRTVRPGEADAAKSQIGNGGRELLGAEIQRTGSQVEGQMTKSPPKPPVSSAQAPQRPARPVPQFLAKRGPELANDSKPAPISSPTATPANRSKKD